MRRVGGAETAVAEGERRRVERVGHSIEERTVETKL